jgi:hypothetical protein
MHQHLQYLQRATLTSLSDAANAELPAYKQTRHYHHAVTGSLIYSGVTQNDGVCVSYTLVDSGPGSITCC